MSIPNIPASAIKLYDSPSYDTEVSGGVEPLSDTLLYPKVEFGYTDVNHNVVITSPYAGRLDSYGSRKIKCGLAETPFDVYLRGVGISLDEVSSNYAIVDTDIFLDSGTNHVIITGQTNSRALYSYVDLAAIDGDGNTVVTPSVSITANNTTASEFLVLNPDIGAVKGYTFSLSFDVSWVGALINDSEYDYAGRIYLSTDLSNASPIFQYNIYVAHTRIQTIDVYNYDTLGDNPKSIRVGLKRYGSPDAIMWSSYRSIALDGSSPFDLPVSKDITYSLYIESDSIQDIFMYRNSGIVDSVYSKTEMSVNAVLAPNNIVYPWSIYLGEVRVSISMMSEFQATMSVNGVTYDNTTGQLFDGISMNTGPFQVIASELPGALGLWHQEVSPDPGGFEELSLGSNSCSYMFILSMILGEPPSHDYYNIYVVDKE
jgi:hypothetical protein